jgi:hypothetical protein
MKGKYKDHNHARSEKDNQQKISTKEQHKVVL